MRCRDTKYWLTARHEGDLTQLPGSSVQEHLGRCAACRSYEHRQQHLDTMLGTPAAQRYHTISTERIMQAVGRQKQITQQLEYIHTQQQARVAHLRKVPVLLAIAFLSVGMVGVLLVAVAFIQLDLLVQVLGFASGVIDLLIVVGQYVQAGMALITRNNLLLSGVALVLVIMVGMWLRLMRYPQEA